MIQDKDDMKTQGPINSKALIAYCHADKAYQEAMKLAEKLYKKVDKRDFTGISYFSHPTTVGSLLLESQAQSSLMVSSALEDMLARNKVKPATIQAMFGDTVLAMVEALTPVRVNGELDLEAYGQRLRAGGYPVQTVKLASMLDHACSVPRKQLSRAFKLFDEIEGLLPYLQAGNTELFKRVQVVLRASRA